MSDRAALKIAIDLMHVPSQVRLHTAAPLPDGVPMLLRIAAGDEEAQTSAALLSDRPREVVRQAATFFIEQILFAPGTDSYRVLGADSHASAGELRRNVALLLRWLHPDLDPKGERSIFIGRVTAAWNDLKTPERRAAYDASLQHRSAARSRLRKSRSGSGGKGKRSRFGRRVQVTRDGQRIGFFRQALSVLLQRPPY